MRLSFNVLHMLRISEWDSVFDNASEILADFDIALKAPETTSISEGLFMNSY